MLPPVMGAGAFLLATFTETAYLDIIKIAAFPALLYFFGVGMMVHFRAGRQGITGLSKEQIPNLKDVLVTKGYLLLPILIILALLVMRFSPEKAAFTAIIATILLSNFRRDTRVGPQKIFNALVLGAKNSLVVGATAGSVGIIVGIVLLAGIGIKFSGLILNLAGSSLFMTIIFTAFASYILGMGLTVTASYVVVSVLAAPALVELGTPLLAAHLAVFWFVETGQVTPPVALAAFAASGIAGCDPNRAGFAAMRFASPLFIAPFLFIYTPILLNGPLINIVETMVSCTIGMISFAGMMQGFWLNRTSVYERLLLGIGSICLFFPSVTMDLLGLIILVGVTIYNRKKAEA
jgi:TRAP transporter 4TM/12TM fusion protein